MANAAKPSSGTGARLRLLAVLAAIGLVAAGCSSDEESRQWYLDQLDRTSTFAPSEARCYVDGVADELGVHALNTSRALPVAQRARVTEIQNECLGIPAKPVAFVGPELSDVVDNNTDLASLDDDTLPDINYNRRKNVMKRLKKRLGLSTWHASCIIDSVMAETDRAVVTWAAASPELQNQVLATCLHGDHHE